jgi:hypothetical protein
MVLYTYIPTGKILKWIGLKEQREIAFAKGMISVIESVKNLKDKVDFQYNPEEIEKSRDVSWAVRGAPGEDKPTLHYVGGSLESLALRLLFDNDIDEFDTKYLDTNFPAKGLYDMIEWFDKLTRPAKELDGPPTIKVSLGSFSIEGVITNLRTKILKSWPNLAPRLVEINATILEAN